MPAPETYLVGTPDEFRAAAEALGYPDRDVCMKPPAAKGSRGFRVLSASVDRRHALLEARPGPLPLSVDEALEAIGPDDFPPLLVMELVTGPEHTVDGSTFFVARRGRREVKIHQYPAAARLPLALSMRMAVALNSDVPDFGSAVSSVSTLV